METADSGPEGCRRGDLGSSMMLFVLVAPLLFLVHYLLLFVRACATWLRAVFGGQRSHKSEDFDVFRWYFGEPASSQDDEK